MRPPALRNALAPLRSRAPAAARAHSGCSNPNHDHSHLHPHHHHHHPPPPPPHSPPSPGASSAGAAATVAAASAGTAAPSPRTPGAPLNLPVSSGGPHEAHAYCASLVRRLDPDAWLQSYFWPRREREWWLAIRAFNVASSVSQPTIAAMRFQFWRDALAAIFSTSSKPVPQHPVALALAEMHAARPVQRYYLSQLIDTRAKALSAPLAAATLEGHLAERGPVSGALLQAALPLVVSPSAPETSHLAHTLSHLGHLLTVSRLLRALPGLVAKRQLNIPHDVAAAHGLVDEDVFRRGAEAAGFKDAAFQLATRGMDELITARHDLKETNGKVVPAAAMPVFLAAVPAESYLKRLEASDFDVFSPELAKHDWRLAPAIWWRYQTGKL